MLRWRKDTSPRKTTTMLTLLNNPSVTQRQAKTNTAKNPINQPSPGGRREIRLITGMLNTFSSVLRRRIPLVSLKNVISSGANNKQYSSNTSPNAIRNRHKGTGDSGLNRWLEMYSYTDDNLIPDPPSKLHLC